MLTVASTTCSSTSVQTGIVQIGTCTNQQAQLPQRNSASATHVCLSIGWLIDRAIHCISSTRVQTGIVQIGTCINQQAQLPQRNSASATHVRLSRLANWSCNSLNNADVVQLDYSYYTSRIDSISQESIRHRCPMKPSIHTHAHTSFKVTRLCVVKKTYFLGRCFV